MMCMRDKDNRCRLSALPSRDGGINKEALCSMLHGGFAIGIVPSTCALVFTAVPIGQWVVLPATLRVSPIGTTTLPQDGSSSRGCPGVLLLHDFLTVGFWVEIQWPSHRVLIYFVHFCCLMSVLSKHFLALHCFRVLAFLTFEKSCKQFLSCV